MGYIKKYEKFHKTDSNLLRLRVNSPHFAPMDIEMTFEDLLDSTEMVIADMAIMQTIPTGVVLEWGRCDVDTMSGEADYIVKLTVAKDQLFRTDRRPVDEEFSVLCIIPSEKLTEWAVAAKRNNQ